MTVIKTLDGLEKTIPTMGVRHVQAAMMFLATTILYGFRVNMSMGIVSMTDSSNEDYFDWSTQIQSVILSSFFWGYIVLQVPAGMIASKYGGKYPITVAVFFNSIASLVLPMAAFNGGWQAVCACRVIQGLAQGLLFPSMHTLIGKWVPLEEKSRLGTFIYAGCQFGTALQYVVSGFIAEAWGWPAIFYCNGAVGAVWVVLYIIVGSNGPAESRFISKDERFYIEQSLGQIEAKEKLPTPWKSIMTSLPFYALIIAHCSQNWGFWTLMTEMPSYFSKVLNVNITANGVLSAVPYCAMFILSFPLGYTCDFFLRRKLLTITASRKLSNTIGFWGPAVALIGLSYAPAGDITAAVIMLTITVGLNAGHYTGFLLVHIDMSPNFGGVLMGITNCLANIISIIAPLVAGVLLQDETSSSEWRKVFYLASVIYILGNLFFLIFGTCEKQPWDHLRNTAKDQEKANETTTASAQP